MNFLKISLSLLILAALFFLGKQLFASEMIQENVQPVISSEEVMPEVTQPENNTMNNTQEQLKTFAFEEQNQEEDFVTAELPEAAL